MRYWDGHQSGFHGVNRDQREEMNSLVACFTDVCGLTEQTGFRFLAKEWHEWGDESKIVWNRHLWTECDMGVISVATVAWTRGTARKTSVEFPWVFLEHAADGQTLLRPVCHLPAHRYKPSQRKAGNQAIRGFGRRLAVLQDRLRPDETTVTGDGNVDFRLDRNVRMFEEALHPAGLRVLVPPKATLRGAARRRIELWATSRPRGDGLEMLPWLDGYDHRGIKRRCAR